MRWVITSTKELRDGVFTEGEILPQNLKAMNFQTHTKLHDDFGKRVIRSKKDMEDLEKKSLVEGSFEIDQSQKNYETITGLDRFNPKAVDPNSLDRFNPKAVELDQEDNTSMPELPTFSPTLGFDIPNNPIEDEVLEPFEQLGLNLEDLNANDLIDPNDFINLDDLLGQIDNLEDLMQEIMDGGTYHQQAPTGAPPSGQQAPTGGVNAAEELGSLYDASVKLNGLNDDKDGGDGEGSLFSDLWDWLVGPPDDPGPDDEYLADINDQPEAEDNYEYTSNSEGTESDSDTLEEPSDEGWVPDFDFDTLEEESSEEGDNGAEDDDGKTTKESDNDEGSENGAEGDIMASPDLPPQTNDDGDGGGAQNPSWANPLDDITGQEDVMPEVSTIEIPLYESTNHLQKSDQTINRSPEFLTKDGVINHDHTSVTMNSAFADNGEFMNFGETYRAEGLFPCPTIPHIQAKNFSELIPTIAMTTIQDI
ncbi:hypothetical protein [Prochlorococcus sp. MIT 1306]|uniref:hypothetical protein n=1 Tax=Prochlorococcus sp. MIT 1306 TaxID=1799667 RepID=UPI0007B3C47D|nr:hypothetical protein [Prochlorococcus sp. MIT 1306]KZR62944.1 hypothetical protein PMIT1306_01426 [Prochlorococcus sp. MIT 1306]